MKRGKKISLIILTILTIVISIVWLSRSLIVREILIETVASRSNGDMALDLDKIDYYPFKKKIEILDLSLVVSNFDTLEIKQTKLRSVSFDSIIISDFDLWELLSKKRIKAGKIITAKPDIVFSQTQKKTNIHTSIGSHFNSVQTKDIKLQVFPIEIGILKVEYGNVLFEADSTNNYLGSADFWIELHEFNTTVDSMEFDSHSFLYSRRLIIDISNFSKPLKNGKDLNIENLKFDSKTDKLEVSSFNISSGNPDLNNSLDSIYLKNIEIAGLSISEIKKVKELKLRSIKVSDGFLSVKPFNKRKTKKTKINQEVLQILFQFIKDVEVDTLSLEKINCDIIGHNNNRIASAKGFDFELIGFSVDTSMYYNNSLPNFNYFNLALKSLTYDSIQQFETHNVTYASNEANLKLSKVLFKDDAEKIDFKSFGILIDGLDIDKILNNKSVNMGLSLTNPEIIINMSSKYFGHNNSKSKFSELFKLSKVDVNQANISLFNDNGLKSNISGLDISFGIEPKGEDTLAKVNLLDLKWASENIDFSLDDKNIQFSSSSSSYENEDLIVGNGIFKYQGNENQNKKIDIDFQNLSVSKFDIIQGVNSNKLTAERIILQKPILDLAFSINDSLKGIPQNDSLFILLPVDIIVGEFLVQEAKLKLDLENKTHHQNLTSDIDLSIKGVDFPGVLGLEQIQQLRLDLDLHTTHFKNDNIALSVEESSFSTSDSSFNLKDISIKLDSVVTENSVIFSNRFVIKDISLTQLDYMSILRSSDFTFNALKITEPDIDLYSNRFNNQPKKEKLLNPDMYGVTKNSFKSIEIESLKLKYNLSSKGSEKRVKVGDFDFKWSPGIEENSNLLKELLVDIKEVELIDTEGQTSIALERLFTNELKKDLEISEIVLNKKVSDKQNGIFLRMPHLSLKNINYNNQLSNGLEIEELSSDTLILEFTSNKTEHKQFSFTGRVEALEKYSDFVNKFNIRNSRFHNVDVEINNISDSIHKKFLLDELDIFVSDVGFSSGDSAMLHLKKITLDLKGRKLITADSLYEISTGEIFYDFANNSISIDSFQLKPRYGMDEFYKRAVWQTGMLDITGEKIVLSGIDFKRAITKKEYVVSAIDLDGFKLRVHRDKNYPFKHGVIKPFLSELLRGLNTKFYVDTVRVNNSNILFGLFMEGSHKPGEVFFDDVNINIRELSNMPSLMSYPPVIKLGFASKIMGKSKVTAKLYFPLNSNDFSYSGKTDELDFRDFNSMTQNLFGISITKGKGYIDIIGINAGDSIATGSIKFKYKKLRVGLYDREKAELDKGIAAPFFSFLVNDLLIKSNNPRFLGKTRTGLVYIEPNREKSFINYIWKGLLSGIMSTMWHNSKEQRKEKKRINSFE